MEMNEYNIIKIKNHPELISRAADWFHEKWYVPAEEYRKSMEESLQSGISVPQWYLVVEDSRIIGGAGVIENDFHAAAAGLRVNCSVLCAMICGKKESIRFILSQIIHRFMRDMVGNTSVWSRKMRVA